MFINTLGVTISTFGLIIYATPFFAVPLLPLLVMYYYIQLYYRRTSREIKRLDSIARSPLYAHFSETLSGLATIRAYKEQTRFVAGNDRLMDLNNRPYFIQIAAQVREKRSSEFFRPLFSSNLNILYFHLY